LSKYLSSDIFAFPSAFEGFPLAMTEAMSAGLPVVAYKTCLAVNELIVDKADGVLVEEGVEPLAEGLRILMSSQELRVKMGKAAHDAMKQYSPQKIWDKWEKVLSLAAEGKEIII
jgi:glycosyltransferase involved in cell wall biosynthesis